MIFQSSKVNFQWSMETFKMVSGIPRSTRARSLAWLERPADNREVMSPNLIGPTIIVLAGAHCIGLIFSSFKAVL